MNNPSFNDLSDALSAPVGDLIASIGKNMADAQQALDSATIENFKSVYESGDATYEALRKIGYQPTWYQIPEVNAEVNIALTVSGTSEESGKKGQLPSMKGRNSIRLYATPVDATFTNKYGFDYTASSKVSFKVVPIPPSAQAEGMKIAPKLVGLTYKDANALLDDLEIEFEFAEGTPEKVPANKKVTAQNIEAGEIIRRTDTLILTF